MILTEEKLHARKIEPIIGKPRKLNFKKIEVIGSTLYRLTSFNSNKNNSQILRQDSRCNFQLYEKGLLLKTTNSTKTEAIPTRFSEINSLKLVRGEETVNPYYLSPMWCLLKLGIPVIKARYFRIRMSEYFINKMRLELNTLDYSLILEADGYKFESQLKLFQRLPLNINSE